MAWQSPVMAPSPNSSFEEALKRASDSLGPEESEFLTHPKVEVLKGSASEAAEAKLRAEAAKMRAMEERKIISLCEAADREAQKCKEKFLTRFTELREALDALNGRVEERALLEITERNQSFIAKARRYSGLFVQLNESASEKSTESAKTFEVGSEEIIELAAKQEEEMILLQKKLLRLRVNRNKKKFAEVASTIDESIATLQQDLPESRSAKVQLIQIKASLLDPANLEKTSIREDALAGIKNILDKYAAALAEREQKKAEEAEATQEAKPHENRYLQAVEKLKRNAEKYTKVFGDNKKLRWNILRFVQLTVNKIRKQTNNGEHALSFFKLFSNETVLVGIGNETLCLVGNPEAPRYAMDLTAKKILDSVEKLPSNPIQEWIPYATVIATLWSMSPRFGEIFYDNLVSRCPFLVPFYFGDLTEEESIAYVTNFVHYKRETWSTFIKRVGYHARLLGVISAMKPRRGVPFPPAKMWALLAGTVRCQMKTKELGEVAAMVMKSLLETCGNTMMSAYGSQFSEFIQMLRMEYIDQLQKIAKNAPGVVSLEIFVKEVITAGCNFPQLLEGDDSYQVEDAM